MKIIPNEQYYYVETEGGYKYIFLKKKNGKDITSAVYIYTLGHNWFYDGTKEKRFRVCSNESIRFIRDANQDEIALIKLQISENKKT